MNEIKSIWDGWEKQCYGTRNDGQGNRCALGWIDAQYAHWERGKNILVNETFARCAEYVRKNYPDTPDAINYSSTRALLNCSVIAAANNALKLTPEQFREIDRLTQIEAIAKPLIDSVPVAEPLGEVDGISYVGWVK